MQNSSSFVQKRLPWLIGAGAFILYLITLSPWISFHGFSTLAKASGWDWRADYLAPAHFIATYPVRWVPIQWQPAAANALAAIFSALALGLLARSVAILPYDRTREQRHSERSEHSFLSAWYAWLPPLVAVLVCGLQLTFWENAVVGTGEAFDLLLFAYVVRCLLEFRIEERESWLTRAAFVFGVAITNNYAMIPFLPLFVGAILWIRGRDFFNLRFLLRMLGWGSLGLSLYFLLPLIATFSGADQGFWQFLKVNLGFQKTNVLGFSKYLLFLLSLVSIFPVVFIGIKWPASFGDINAAGTALTNLMTHVIHAVFLLAIFYVAFDPPFSPRKLGQGHAFLPLIYLGALSAGYFAGYFLLVFNPKGPQAWGRRSSFKTALNYGITGLLLIAAVAVPIGLFAKNVKQVRWERGPEYSQFGKLAAASLPAEGAVVLSDDSVRLFAVHSALVTKGHEDKYVLVDTSALQDPSYHAYLAHNHPKIWPSAYGKLSRKEPIPQMELIQLMHQLSQSRPIFYLHPSFGYYFESFYSVPKQVVYQLFPYTTNMSFAPLLKPEETKELDQYWQNLRRTEIKHLPEVVKVARSDKQQSGTSFYMSAIYAKSVNDLGVRLQRAGEIEKARDFFDWALQLNPDNVSALINSEYNAQLRAGSRESGPPSEAVRKRLATYNGSWEGVMQYNGPLDEPNSCYLVAQAFARGNNFRQSAGELTRVCELTPNNIPAHLALAVVYAESGRSEDAIRKVTEIRSKFSNLNVTDHLTLAECEAWARLFQNDLAGAEKALTSAQEQYPDRPEPYKALAEIYLNRRDAAKAGVILEKLVKLQPENVDGLINYAALQMRQERYAEAIPYLDRALLLHPENFYARLNRGIANFKTGKLDAAWEDYQTLERSLPKPTYIVHFALGEIARQKNQKRTALEHYQKYLELAPPGTQEVKDVQAKIKALKNGTA